MTLQQKLNGFRVQFESRGPLHLTRVGLPLLIPLPWPLTFAIFAYAMVSCLIVNDAVKLGMINWRVPTAVA
jgi:H+-transporting ATPase